MIDGVSYGYLSPNKQMILTRDKDNNDGRYDLVFHVYAIDGGGLLHSFRNDENAGTYTWSPDSTKIAYRIVSKRDSHTGSVIASELYLMNIDGTGKTQLTDTPDTAERLRGWTTDGKPCL